jgi:hypothetical protein
MKIVAATAAVLLGAAGMASAQDGRKMDELQREFDRAMKGLQQKFDEERARLEKEFRAARERLTQPQKPQPKGEPPPFEKKMDTQELLQRVLERLERLERKLDQDLPRFDFKEMPFKHLPRDFDFRKFEKELEPFREFAPRWREFVPKFKDEEFRFEFKKKHDDEKEEKKVEKKKAEKKEDKGDDKKKY